MPRFLNTNLFKLMINKLKLLNRKRLELRMIRKVTLSDSINRLPRPRPKNIKYLLFIEIQEGWGDFVYFLGLLESLHKQGLIIDVISLSTTYERYQNHKFIRNAYSISDVKLVNIIRQQNYDIAFDITYVNIKEWETRRRILNSLTCYTITAGNITSHSNLYDEYIDLGKAEHWKERNALIFDCIIQPKTKSAPIPPVFTKKTPSISTNLFLSSWHQNQNYIYVNTITRSQDRSLSKSQITELINLFNERKKSIGIFYTSFQIEETEFVKKLPEMSFSDLANVIEHCKAIISPDTSIIHLGSIFNIPVLGFYCGNYRDYWQQYPQAKAWAPISKNSEIYYEDDSDITSESDFIYTHKKKIVSSYTPSKIKSVTNNFLSKLQL